MGEFAGAGLSGTMPRSCFKNSCRRDGRLKPWGLEYMCVSCVRTLSRSIANSNHAGYRCGHVRSSETVSGLCQSQILTVTSSNSRARLMRQKKANLKNSAWSLWLLNPLLVFLFYFTSVRSGKMEIKRIDSHGSAAGSPDWFTGTVRIEPLFQVPDPALVQSASVAFEPGARTAWHTHPLGQMLIVTAGRSAGEAMFTRFNPAKSSGSLQMKNTGMAQRRPPP